MKKKLPSAFNKTHLIFAAGAAALIGVTVIVTQVAAPAFSQISYVGGAATSTATSTGQMPAQIGPAPAHVKTPDQVRAIYMSQCVAGTPSFRDSLIKFIDNTNLNAVVIDIKDYSGGISFPTDDPVLKPYVSKQCGADDMKDFIAALHAKNIYVIGRITTFQDPTYAKAHPELAVRTKEGGIWKNYGGLAFIDVGAKPFWDYIVELAKVSHDQIGFDELNFDYIRFPSDGPMKDADYTFDRDKTKEQALEEFFAYLHDHVAPTGAVMSADLFGYTTVHTDDLGIGQVLERALPYFDYIDPMVYPSHYNSGFDGLKNVNSDPYDVVHISLVTAMKRALATTTVNYAFNETPIASTSPQLYEKPVYPASKIRPWLQSFDYPVVYTPAMVEDQIKATNDAGLTAWLFWDAANKYTSLRSVLSGTAAL